MKAVTKFEAYDGTIFNSKKECLNYEKRRDGQSHCFMFTREGVKTDDPDMAMVVYIENTNSEEEDFGAPQPAAVWFIEHDKAHGPGIDDSDYGLFVYDEFDEAYKYIPEDVFPGLKAGLRVAEGNRQPRLWIKDNADLPHLTCGAL